MKKNFASGRCNSHPNLVKYSYMSFIENHLEAAKKKLEMTKKDLEKEIADLKTAPEFGSDVDHFEEETDEAEEFNKNLGVEKTLKERLINVERALEKMAKGIYGKCENCKKDIEWEVLRVDPESRYCQNCKTLGVQ